MIRALRFASLLCLGLAAPAWADGLPFFAGGDGALLCPGGAVGCGRAVQ